MPARFIVPDVASLKDFVGVDLGVSDWIGVTQDQINAFAEATGDRQWIHVDEERARRESPFGQTVAHGYLTIALVSVLLPQIIAVEKCSRVVNYGVDRLRLREPVPANSRLRLGGEIKNVRSLAGGAARTTFAMRWEVDGARRPVCLANLVYVYYP